MAKIKFIVESKTENSPGGQFHITLRAVTDSKENVAFWGQQPQGRIELSGVKTESADLLKAGKTYSIEPVLDE